MPENNNISLRSDEIQEIMSRPPKWMVQWGITLIFIILIIFLSVSWLIKYPDTIQGEAVLTTSSPPVKLISKSSGEIQQLHIKNGEGVKKGQVIASIQSNLPESGHLFLTKEIATIDQLLATDKIQEYEPKQTIPTLGELQQPFLECTRAIKNYQILVVDNNVNFVRQNLQSQIANFEALNRINRKQLLEQQSLTENAKSKFESDKTIYEKGIISKSEFYSRKKEYSSAISSYDNMDKTIIQTSISINDLRKQLNQIEQNYKEQSTVLLAEISNSLGTIKNSLKSWQRSYQITAPCDGKLTYLSSHSTNQFIEQGKALFAIIPSDNQYEAQINISKAGYGKVKKGQRVMLKMHNFPHHEFGQLQGTVQEVSPMSNESQYLIKVSLDTGLKSTYKRQLDYSPEMTGEAEIITEDLRITDRIFNKFKKLFD